MMSKEMRRILLDAAVTTGNTLSKLGTCTLRLAKAPMVINEDMTPGSFTQADFTGYVEQDLAAAGDPVGDPNGNTIQLYAGFIFRPAAPYTVPNTIFGWWLQPNDLGTPVDMVAYAHALAEPVAMAGVDDFLQIAPYLAISDANEPIDAVQE